jgi:fatty-acyl-CoA synthase
MNVAFRAGLEPDRPAVYWRGNWITYGQLDRDIEVFAARMRQAGVRDGDRVALLALNHPVHLHGIYAAGRHAWIHAPLNYRLPPKENAALVEHLEASVLVYGPEMEACAEAVRDRLPALRLIPLAELEAPGDEVVIERSRRRPDDDATRMLLFTGGTTGIPKAAIISNRMFEVNAWDTVAAWGLGPDDATVLPTPMFHAGVNALATPLLEIGGRIGLIDSFTAAGFLKAGEECGTTVVFAVPTMFQMIVEAPEFATTDFSKVKYAIAGGSPCPQVVRDAFTRRGVRFKLGYGMTEAGVNCFAITLNEADRKPVGVGRPMPHLEAVIRNQDGTPVAKGEVGELTLRGPQVTSGYWAKPAETAEALRPAEDGGTPFLWTGDLAREDEDGCFFIVGRRKEMFISGGENVFPVEVERALYDHPGILECAVVGVPDERWGEVGLAGVVLRPGQEAAPETLRAFLKERLAGYKVPKHFLYLTTLPKSEAGKVLKRAIADSFINTRAAARQEVAP